MPQKEWSITLDNIKHTIELKHGTLLRKYYLKLDGVSLSPKRDLIEKGDKLTFNITTHTCIVIIKSHKGGFAYDCIVDDRSIETGQKTEIPPEWVPPKESCLKYGVYYLVGTVIIGLISSITGISEDKIDLILLLIVVTLIIFAFIQHLWKKHH